MSNGEYYSFEITAEYDRIELWKYTPQSQDYGQNLTAYVSYPISGNVNYTLRIEIQGDTFTGYLNDQQMLTGKDASYITGKVGLRARNANVFFDDFNETVTR